MKFSWKSYLHILVLMFCSSFLVHATPFTIIWIPSSDIQPYGVYHLGIDNYFNAFKEGTGAFPTDLGLTVGILPFSSVQAEIGIDLFEPQHSPWSFNAKIAIPEGTLADWSPAVAVGGFGFGFEKNVTEYNILYGIVARTFPIIGRISTGYYVGNSKILKDPNGSVDEAGVLLSWDKQVTEIDERLWLAVDYQGGENILGALSFGFAWSFSKNVSVIFGRNIFNNNTPRTFTTQLDINI